MKLEGFGIFVKDMAVMVRFYRDVLGFEIKDGTLFLLYGRNDFEKMTGRRFRYADGVQGHCEIALAVENFAMVDKVFGELVGKGAEPIMEPTADPEGNLVEIGSFVER